jgi:integrase
MAITAWDVEAWIADMQKRRVGATTLVQSVQFLRYMLADAARHRLIQTDPTSNVKLPKIPKHVDRFLSLVEYEALEAAMPTDRDKCMVRLMAYGGLRWEEVAGLHVHRVDLTNRRLTVVEVLRRDTSIKKRGKSAASQRYVPIGEDLAGMLRALMPDVGLVFPGLDYTNWRRRVFVPAVERAGLAAPRPTPHDLRHTFGSWLAEGGMPPTDIMALMGHTSLRATERYLHAGDGRFARALTALPVRRIEA